MMPIVTIKSYHFHMDTSVITKDRKLQGRATIPNNQITALPVYTWIHNNACMLNKHAQKLLLLYFPNSRVKGQEWPC